VGFVVVKVTLGQVFFEYFGFPCQSSFYQMLHNHPHLSYGDGTIGLYWPLSLGINTNTLAKKKKKGGGGGGEEEEMAFRIIILNVP
jgi:hypothetical protein